MIIQAGGKSEEEHSLSSSELVPQSPGATEFFAANDEKEQVGLPSKTPPPGPGWVLKVVQHDDQSCCHWLSPTRQIKFKVWKQACDFKLLRSAFGNDEIGAWFQYRTSMADTDA